MSLITKFEDLESWELSRGFVSKIYYHTNKEKIQNDFGFQNQIRRAALSIMNNIAEGFGRYNNKEFRRFLDIAAASNLEVKSMLYLGFDLEYIAKSKIDDLIQQNEKLHFQLLALIKYLRSKSN